MTNNMDHRAARSHGETVRFCKLCVEVSLHMQEQEGDEEKQELGESAVSKGYWSVSLVSPHRLRSEAS